MSFKICTIGCGQHASKYHGPSYAQYAAAEPDTVLAACCDIDEAKAIQFQQRFGFARHYTDLESMLQHEHPDAVCLIAPEALTCELACRVLDLGYPLLMEKPPGQTIVEIDRMIAAANASGAANQVAFNRRYAPLTQALLRQLDQHHLATKLQYIGYDFTRIGRTDPDFSTTAIHGIDAVRCLAGSDYISVRFHYQALPTLDATTVNIFMQCTLASGTTAQLNFCPVAGVVTERATLHAHDHTFFLQLPIWHAFDMPGRLQHLEKGEVRFDRRGTELGAGTHDYELMGFYAENASFFADIRHNRRPSGDLSSARQSVEVAQCIRERKPLYQSKMG